MSFPSFLWTLAIASPLLPTIRSRRSILAEQPFVGYSAADDDEERMSFLKMIMISVHS